MAVALVRVLRGPNKRFLSEKLQWANGAEGLEQVTECLDGLTIPALSISVTSKPLLRLDRPSSHVYKIVKLSLCLFKQNAMRTCGGVDVLLHLSSPHMQVSGQPHAPAA
jgi:hypothetical protein